MGWNNKRRKSENSGGGGVKKKERKKPKRKKPKKKKKPVLPYVALVQKGENGNPLIRNINHKTENGGVAWEWK